MAGTTTANTGTPKTAQQVREEVANLWQNLQLPNINTTPLSGYNWLQDFVPQTYQPYIGQSTPITVNPLDRQQQENLLSALQTFGTGGFQPSDQGMLNLIAQNADKVAYGNANSAINDLRNRGLGGSGAETVARMMASQNANDEANSAGLNLSQQAMQRGLQALAYGGNIAANVANQDNSVAEQQAQILNNFNTQVQGLRTAAAQNTANVNNQAQQANLAGRQNTANLNTGIANQNLDRANTLGQLGLNNQTTKLSNQGNALLGVATGMDASQAAAAANAQAAAANTRADLGLGITGLTALNSLTSTPGTLLQPGSPGIISQGLNSLFGTGSSASGAAATPGLLSNIGTGISDAASGIGTGISNAASGIGDFFSSLF